LKSRDPQCIHPHHSCGVFIIQVAKNRLSDYAVNRFLKELLVTKYILAVLFGTLGAVVFVCGIVYAYTHLPVPHHAETDPSIAVPSVIYADDPVMLYETVGIKVCEHDVLYKVEETRAVLLEDSDLTRIKPVLEKTFAGTVAAVLYVNAPRSVGKARGQPVLVPLRREAGTYCALGVIESWKPSLFLELEAKYQPQLK
jgi:hypothetical protein